MKLKAVIQISEEFSLSHGRDAPSLSHLYRGYQIVKRPKHKGNKTQGPRRHGLLTNVSHSDDYSRCGRGRDCPREEHVPPGPSAQVFPDLRWHQVPVNPSYVKSIIKSKMRSVHLTDPRPQLSSARLDRARNVHVGLRLGRIV